MVCSKGGGPSLVYKNNALLFKLLEHVFFMILFSAQPKMGFEMKNVK